MKQRIAIPEWLTMNMSNSHYNKKTNDKAKKCPDGLLPGCCCSILGTGHRPALRDRRSGRLGARGLGYDVVAGASAIARGQVVGHHRGHRRRLARRGGRAYSAPA